MEDKSNGTRAKDEGKGAAEEPEPEAAADAPEEPSPEAAEPAPEEPSEPEP